MKLNAKSAALLFGTLLIAACDSSDEAGEDEVTGIDTFGAAFRAMFEAGPNADPVDAQNVDISVNRAADPFNP